MKVFVIVFKDRQVSICQAYISLAVKVCGKQEPQRAILPIISHGGVDRVGSEVQSYQRALSPV
jgi:hypothetical protein